MPLSTTQDVFDYLHAHVTSAALNAALELGLFWKLAARPQTDSDLAAAFGFPPGRCRAWLDVLVSLGLLDTSGGPPDQRLYSVSTTAQSAILDGHPEIVWSFRAQRYRERYRLADNLSVTLAHPGSVWDAHGLPEPSDYALLRADPAWARRFTQFLYALKQPWAAEWSAGFDLSTASRMLDLGGGSGVISMELLRRFPALTSLVLELEHVVIAAREIASGLEPEVARRLTYQAADFVEQPLPAGFDFVLLADVGLYTERLFRKVHGALNPGGHFAIIHPFATAAEILPKSQASSAFQATLADPEFIPDTIPQVQALLETAGFSNLPPRSLSQGFTVLEALKLAPAG